MRPQGFARPWVLLSLLSACAPLGAQSSSILVNIADSATCTRPIGPQMVCMEPGMIPKVRLSGPQLQVTATLQLLTAATSQWLRVRSGSEGALGNQVTATLPVDLELVDDSGALPAGNHLAFLNLQVLQSNERIRIPIRLARQPEANLLVADPDDIEVSMPAGAGVRREVLVRFQTAETIEARLTATPETLDGGPWLSVDLTGGARPCASQPLECSIALDIRAPAVLSEYVGLVWVRDSVNSRVNYIRVRLNVTAPPQTDYSADPAAPSASAPVGGAKVSLPVKVTSPAPNIPFLVSTAAEWLAIGSTGSTLPATLTLTFDPAGLEPGTYTTPMFIRELNTERLLLNIPVTFHVVAPEYLPQITDGGGWKTRIYLVNTQPLASTYSLRLWTSPVNPVGPAPGQPWLVEFKDAGRKSQFVDESVPAHAVRVLETTGSGSTPLHGWAEFRPTGPITAFVVLQRNGGGGGRLPPAEVALPIGNAFRGSVIAPFDHLEKATTELFLANADENAARITIRVRNESGADMGPTRTIELAGRAQRAILFTDESVIPFKTEGIRGSVELSADAGQLVAAAVRRRGEGVAFSPVLPKGTFWPNRGLAQFVFGGPWQTTLHLLNPGERDQNGEIRFWRRTSGEEFPVALAGDGQKRVQVAPTVPARQGVILSTAAGETETAAGWAEVSYQQPVGGFARLLQTRDGNAPILVEYESTILSQRGSVSRVSLPFDNRGGLGTEVALVNLDDRQTDLQVIISDERARFPREVDSLRLPSLGQVRLRVDERFEEWAGRQGIIEIRSRTGNRLAGVSLRVGNGAALVLPLTP